MQAGIVVDDRENSLFADNHSNWTRRNNRYQGVSAMQLPSPSLQVADNRPGYLERGKNIICAL
jgi:hypothetical protein